MAMTSVNFKIYTKSKINDALLMLGLPFKRGVFKKDQRLEIYNRQNKLPLWWDIRSYWPDGSIKWVFIHTRVPAGDNTLTVKSMERTSESFKHDKNISHDVIFKNNMLKVEDCELNIAGNKWCFKTPDGEWNLLQENTDTDLVPVSYNSVSGYGNPKVELLEESPIAPLIRIKPAENCEGFITDRSLRSSL